MSAQGYPGIYRGADPAVIADKINQMNQGKINVTLDITLTASAAHTTVTDPRIGITSNILWTPTSAHAAAEIAAGGMDLDLTTLKSGSVNINHANNAQTDRTFRLTIIG